MAVKTFASGDILTASDTNTYLANAGLDYINSWTVGSGVTSVTLTNAFPSTYNMHRLVWVGGSMTSSSGDSQLGVQVGNGGTWNTANYYQILQYVIRASNTTARAAGAEATNTYIAWIGGGSTSLAFMDVTFQNVNLAAQTWVTSPAYCAWPTSAFGFSSGFINNATAYADAKIIVSGTGTMSSGKIYSYGYRLA